MKVRRTSQPVKSVKKARCTPSHPQHLSTPSRQLLHRGAFFAPYTSYRRGFRAAALRSYLQLTPALLLTGTQPTRYPGWRMVEYNEYLSIKEAHDAQALSDMESIFPPMQRLPVRFTAESLLGGFDYPPRHVLSVHHIIHTRAHAAAHDYTYIDTRTPGASEALSAEWTPEVPSLLGYLWPRTKPRYANYLSDYELEEAGYVLHSFAPTLIVVLLIASLITWALNLKKNSFDALATVLSSLTLQPCSPSTRAGPELTFPAGARPPRVDPANRTAERWLSVQWTTDHLSKVDEGVCTHEQTMKVAWPKGFPPTSSRDQDSTFLWWKQGFDSLGGQRGAYNPL